MPLTGNVAQNMHEITHHGKKKRPYRQRLAIAISAAKKAGRYARAGGPVRLADELMSEAQQLHRAVAANPHDRAAWAALADWMHENGKPAFGEALGKLARAPESDEQYDYHYDNRGRWQRTAKSLVTGVSEFTSNSWSQPVRVGIAGIPAMLYRGDSGEWWLPIWGTRPGMSSPGMVRLDSGHGARLFHEIDEFHGQVPHWQDVADLASRRNTPPEPERMSRLRRAVRMAADPEPNPDAFRKAVDEFKHAVNSHPGWNKLPQPQMRSRPVAPPVPWAEPVPPPTEHVYDPRHNPDLDAAMTRPATPKPAAGLDPFLEYELGTQDVRRHPAHDPKPEPAYAQAPSAGPAPPAPPVAPTPPRAQGIERLRAVRGKLSGLKPPPVALPVAQHAPPLPVAEHAHVAHTPQATGEPGWFGREWDRFKSDMGPITRTVGGVTNRVRRALGVPRAEGGLPVARPVNDTEGHVPGAEPVYDVRYHPESGLHLPVAKRLRRAGQRVRMGRLDSPGLWAAVAERPLDLGRWGMLADSLDEEGKGTWAQVARLVHHSGAQTPWQHMTPMVHAIHPEGGEPHREMGSVYTKGNLHGVRISLARTKSGVHVGIDRHQAPYYFASLAVPHAWEPGLVSELDKQTDRYVEPHAQLGRGTPTRLRRAVRLAAADDPGLIRAAAEHPWDDARHLILADSLEEQGSPPGPLLRAYASGARQNSYWDWRDTGPFTESSFSTYDPEDNPTGLHRLGHHGPFDLTAIPSGFGGDPDAPLMVNARPNIGMGYPHRLHYNFELSPHEVQGLARALSGDLGTRLEEAARHQWHGQGTGLGGPNYRHDGLPGYDDIVAEPPAGPERLSMSGRLRRAVKMSEPLATGDTPPPGRTLSTFQTLRTIKGLAHSAHGDPQPWLDFAGHLERAGMPGVAEAVRAGRAVDPSNLDLTATPWLATSPPENVTSHLVHMSGRVGDEIHSNHLEAHLRYSPATRQAVLRLTSRHEAQGDAAEAQRKLAEHGWDALSPEEVARIANADSRELGRRSYAVALDDPRLIAAVAADLGRHELHKAGPEVAGALAKGQSPGNVGVLHRIHQAVTGAIMDRPERMARADSPLIHAQAAASPLDKGPWGVLADSFRDEGHEAWAEAADNLHQRAEPTWWSGPGLNMAMAMHPYLGGRRSPLHSFERVAGTMHGIPVTVYRHQHAAEAVFHHPGDRMRLAASSYLPREHATRLVREMEHVERSNNPLYKEAMSLASRIRGAAKKMQRGTPVRLGREDLAGLLAAIREKPQDMATWLIAADAMDEEGHAHAARLFRQLAERPQSMYSEHLNDDKQRGFDFVPTMGHTEYPWGGRHRISTFGAIGGVPFHLTPLVGQWEVRIGDGSLEAPGRGWVEEHLGRGLFSELAPHPEAARDHEYIRSRLAENEPERMARYPLAPRKKWRDDPHHQRAGGKFTWVRPEEWLKRAPPLGMSAGDRRVIDRIKKRIEKGHKLNPLMLGDGDEHDGRHRAHAAVESGVRWVPCMDYSTKKAKAARGDVVIRMMREAVTVAGLDVVDLTGVKL